MIEIAGICLQHCVTKALLMNSKLTRTILIALTLGFFVVWVLEFRRTTMFESYWLLLLSIMCLLLFQFSRLKASLQAKRDNELNVNIKKDKPAKTAKK
jgi:Ca2+/Na+ antiporter